MKNTQEPKYKIKGETLVNRQTGVAIPDDEPVFILRARDIYAIRTLEFYRHFFAMHSDHSVAVSLRIKQFKDFEGDHTERMKVPDSQIGPDWPGFQEIHQ